MRAASPRTVRTVRNGRRPSPRAVKRTRPSRVKPVRLFVELPVRAEVRCRREGISRGRWRGKGWSFGCARCSASPHSCRVESTDCSNYYDSSDYADDEPRRLRRRGRTVDSTRRCWRSCEYCEEAEMTCCSLNPHLAGVSLHIVEWYPTIGPGLPVVWDDGASVQTLNLGAIVVDTYHRAYARNWYWCLDLKVDSKRFLSSRSGRCAYRSGSGRRELCYLYLNRGGQVERYRCLNSRDVLGYIERNIVSRWKRDYHAIGALGWIET